MKKLLVTLFTLLSMSAFAVSKINYTSIAECAVDAYSSEGRDLPKKDEAKAYCLKL